MSKRRGREPLGLPWPLWWLLPVFVVLNVAAFIAAKLPKRVTLFLMGATFGAALITYELFVVRRPLGSWYQAVGGVLIFGAMMAISWPEMKRDETVYSRADRWERAWKGRLNAARRRRRRAR